MHAVGTVYIQALWHYILIAYAAMLLHACGTLTNQHSWWSSSNLAKCYIALQHGANSVSQVLQGSPCSTNRSYTG